MPYQQLSESATILEEVSITAKPIEKKRNVFADYEVSGNWMRENNIVSVMYGNQRRETGMRILVDIGPDGFPHKYILLCGAHSFVGASNMEA
jgi:hypothetical protein